MSEVAANPATTPISGIQALHKPRSLENLASAQAADNEISKVRAKLRSVNRPTSLQPTSIDRRNVGSDVAGHKNKPSQDSLERQDILSELDDLLVGALEKVKTTAGDELDENADITASTSSADQSSTPQTSFRRYSLSRPSLASGHSRLHSTSCHQRSTTEESVALESSTNTDPIGYIEMPADNVPAERHSKEHEDHLPVTMSLQSGPSPVKARAALFERMHYHVPGEYIHDRPNREDTITTSTVRSIRKKLETKDFGSRPIHTPPIELALPQLIGHPCRHSQRSSQSTYDEKYQYDTAKQLATMSPPTAPPKHDRKVSIPWPFKWNLFPQDKVTPAPPRPSGVEAKAETAYDEHVTDSSLEHITNHTYVSPTKPAISPSREPSQKRLVTGDPKGQSFTGGVNSPQKKAKVFTEERKELHTEADPKKPETPKKRIDLVSNLLMTPTKSGTPGLKPSTAPSSPHTPLRGRARSGRRNSYAIEQRYSLSRSRSRGGVKVQVEVRSSNPSPERAKDDTIIIIRANVEPLEE
jgi:hypothetical protein